MKSFTQKRTKNIFFLIIAVLFSLPASHADALIVEPGFEVETVAGGLTIPTTMTHTQDGRIFVAEKGGTVRVIKNGTLLSTPVISLTDVNTFGDRGLLGMAVDQNFESNGYLYLSYTYENSPGSNFSGSKTARLIRVTVVGDIASEASKVVLVGTVGGTALAPSCDDYPMGTDCIPSDSMSHSAGAVKFGPDGYLYATFGDGANFDVVDPRALRSQNLDSLAGKMIRINTDGTAPTDNPFFDGNQNSNRSKVYAFGLRNPFRFNFMPTSGKLLLGDVGWSTSEEINDIVSGANYGWPCYEGVELTAYGCAVSPVAEPFYVYGHDTNGAGAVTGGSFSSNNAYPDSYDTSLFVGDYAQNWIKRLVLDANNGIPAVEDFMTDSDGPVDIETGPDGTIYYLAIYTGEVRRLTHTAGNRRPVPEVIATPSSGLAPLQVSFSSEGSFDPDGDVLAYAWSFGDGVTSDLPNPSHTYGAGGTYSATLTLTDGNGASASKSVIITAGNQAPTPTIVSPGSGALYMAGEAIELTGDGFDPEDGALPASAFRWQIILHHNVHTHIVQEFEGVKNPLFTAPNHGSSDVYIEAKLTVVDSGGLNESRSINLYLNTGTNSGNLISNHSIEVESALPGIPTAWFKGGYGVNNAIHTYPVVGFDGGKAARLEINNYTSGDAKWCFDSVFVSPGQEYIFSNYYTATTQSAQVAQFGFSNGTYQYRYLDFLPATQTPTFVEQRIIIPEGVQTFTVFHSLERVGILTVDNYSLTLVPGDTDTLAPIVTVVSPLDGSAVSGVVAVSVNATDTTGVARVTLRVDGTPILTDDTTAPYEFNLDTSGLTNGLHVLSATASDVAGNVGISGDVSIQVSNSTDSENLIVNGSFEATDGINPVGWLPVGWGTHERTFRYPIVGFDGGDAVEVQITSYPPGGEGDSRWQFADISVTPGIEYTYEEQYKATTISDVIGRYTMSDGTVHYFGLTKELPATSDWRFNTGKFVPPANTVSVTLLHVISTVARLSLDETKLFVSGTGTPSEIIPPVATFTSPTNGAVVSGTVLLSADASDNIGVAGLFFAINGTPFGPEMPNAPYAIPWDTTTVANGAYTLKVTVRDAVGNNSNSSILVTVDNSNPVTNAIVNPSLETSGASGEPAGWLRGGWGTNDRVLTYPVPGIEGADAARVEITSFSSGDAKWYFSDVSVNPGSTYTFSHSYRSSVPTNMTVRYTRTDGTVQYVGIGNLPASANWVEVSETLTIPAGVASLTVFHALVSVGFLEIDNFSLSSGSTDTFNRGMVSLTFDDGWLSHYTDALPILNTKNVKGTFFVVSEETLGATPDERITNPSFEAVGADGDPDAWFRGGWGTNNRLFTYPAVGKSGASAARVDITSYTSGDAKWYFAEATAIPNQDYKISDSYNSTAYSEAVIRYTLADGGVRYVFLEGLPSTGGTWSDFSKIVTIPSDAVSLTLFHVLAGAGSLTVDDYSLKRVQVFIDPAQLLSIAGAGHEIGGHTKTHVDLTTVNQAERERQITGSRSDILGMGVPSVTTFAYPFGAYDESIQTITANSGYVAARSVDRGYNVKTTDKYALKIQQIDKTTTLEQVNTWIAQAEQDDTWLILMFHQIDLDPMADLGISAELLGQIVDRVKTADVDIVTMGEGVARMNQ